MKAYQQPKLQDQEKREALFNQLVEEAYERGKAIEAASHLEIDAVIHHVKTRNIIINTIRMTSE